MMNWKHLPLLVFLATACFHLPAQAPRKWASADIYESIRKLNFLGSALYVAAHPDDENTRLIAYLANEAKAETAYLSITRGDGGQNLIGPEIEELLGVIRTQELLAARRIDGGRQMFTRANDFGYSKHPDETLEIWNREAVLSDVVWAIRKWQPDVIINRFDHESAGRTHGHHTSSAILSYEAFDIAGDPNAFPDQLKYVAPWKPRRLFFNTSWWFYGSRDAFDKADKSSMMSVDVGTYYPIKGKSNTEIAAESRSMHKCQGFGSAGERGSQQEYLQLLKGDLPPGKEGLFAGINTTWSRVKGGEKVGAILEKAEQQFDHTRPYEVLSLLLEAYQAMQQLPDGYWKQVKTEEIKEVILASMGLFVEAVADSYSATPGETIEVKIEAVNRSPAQPRLEMASYLPNGIDTALNLVLENNREYEFFKKIPLPENMAFTNPYWLNEARQLGMYTVKEQLLRGKPETPRALKVLFRMNINGVPLEFERDVIFKKTDEVDGELYRPFEVVPPVFANIAQPAYIFGSSAPQEVKVRVKAGRPDVEGSVKLELPAGWRAEPEQAEVQLSLKEEEKLVSFRLYPPEDQSEGTARAIVSVNGKDYDKGLALIGYDHIPTQTVMQESKARVVRVSLEKAGDRIGYIMGAGDEIPNSLRQIGYEVTILDDQDINLENLQKYDAVILGIRIYNTNERMQFHQPRLMEYVRNGGTLIAQYNTTWNLKMPSEEIAPYPLKISRDRVAVEEAEVRLLKPEHPILNWPNEITQADFDGWVQERGLYFPNEWAEQYEAILSCNDPGEPPSDGGLLVARYGEGYYIYTSYSWFRELPAGVPGAFRLFANMISIGKKLGP